jgi:hypothetical protein
MKSVADEDPHVGFQPNKIWLSGNRCGKGKMWGCFYGGTTKTPSHTLSFTGIPKDPKILTDEPRDPGVSLRCAFSLSWGMIQAYETTPGKNLSSRCESIIPMEFK